MFFQKIIKTAKQKISFFQVSNDPSRMWSRFNHLEDVAKDWYRLYNKKKERKLVKILWLNPIVEYSWYNRLIHEEIFYTMKFSTLENSIVKQIRKDRFVTEFKRSLNLLMEIIERALFRREHVRFSSVRSFQHGTHFSANSQRASRILRASSAFNFLLPRSSTL